MAALAGIKIKGGQITIQKLNPHKPKSLPKGKMGIYIFHHEKDCLKIGKAGANSGPRFKSHHYAIGRSPSNLAKSLLDDINMQRFGLTKEIIGEWIRNNTERTDILVDEALGIFTLNLLEAFLHCRLNPRYEGFKSQKVSAKAKTEIEDWLKRKITVTKAETKNLFSTEEFGPKPVPFGYNNAEWKKLLAMMRPQDELWEFTSPEESWKHLAGRAGIALVRDRKVIHIMETIIN